MGVCCVSDHHLRVPKLGQPIENSDISACTRLESIRKYYEFVKIIGYGQFGTVREAVKIIKNNNRSIFDRSEMLKGKHYAIKSISKEKIKKGLWMLKRELEILQLVDHPNIVKLYEIFEDSKYIHMVMELCTGGDLLDYLISKGTLLETEVAQIMKSLLGAVNHLHSLKISHRDIKPENCLLVNSEPNAEIKLVDFGMSIKFGDDAMTTMVGTPYYLAPEVLKSKYGKECDVWSFGVLMYLLLSGKQPFKGLDINDLFRKIMIADYNFDDSVWQNISESAKDLIAKMFVLNPELRITISQALKHEWLNSFSADMSARINLEVFNSIKSFKTPSKLWREAMKVLVRNLSEDQLGDLHAAFDEIDISKTGFVTPQDIVQAMKRNGYDVAADEFDLIIRGMSYLGKGKLNYTQFLIAAMDRRRFLDEESLWAIFQHFDIENKGRITVKNLKYALQKAGCFISDDDFNDIIEEFKLQVNEYMDFSQFKEIMTCFSEQITVNNTEDDESAVFERPPAKRLSQRRLTIRRNSQVLEEMSGITHTQS
ncbi:unnamed protein product [Blepharisma stoltei]|uniref:Calcium-dependent protein kinase n=1 Tax=Blepharisma stoltei TaxID=1481888 RepID=A0AAU9J5S9_9CILI|nr:unnamed protein product [Blepharisma stoltei]